MPDFPLFLTADAEKPVGEETAAVEAEAPLVKSHSALSSKASSTSRRSALSKASAKPKVYSACTTLLTFKSRSLKTKP